jgi:hypothetical protein
MELHRRNCHDYNKRNKEESANNYLGKKLEHVKPKTVKENNKKPPPDPTHPKVSQFPLLSTLPFSLPVEIIIKEYGVRNMVIIHYLVRKIITQLQSKDRGVP